MGRSSVMKLSLGPIYLTQTSSRFTALSLKEKKALFPWYLHGRPKQTSLTLRRHFRKPPGCLWCALCCIRPSTTVLT
jgi:hypothetical protein